MDHLGGIQFAVLRPGHDVASFCFGAPFSDLHQPVIVLEFTNLRDQIPEHGAQVAHQGDVDGYVLVDLGRVDLNVDFAGLRRVGAQVSRNPVVKTHAESQQQIGILDR